MTVEERVQGAVALEVSGLSVAFGPTQVVADVAFASRPGEILGVVGESGSGKTTAMLAAIGFVPPGGRRLGGQAMLGATSLFECRPEALRKAWAQRISYVPQDAIGSLNPARKVGSLLREVLTVHVGLSRRAADARAEELFASVGIPSPKESLRKYPHEFSGGQAQRVALALAFATRPELLVLDEPTTGLDVTTQAEVISTLRELISGSSTSAIFISHDLALLREIAERLIVMYAGEVVESGVTADLMQRPSHPYTRALVDAVPSRAAKRTPTPLAGMPPGRVVEARCAFAERCRWAVVECETRHPVLQTYGGERSVRCDRQPGLGTLLPVTGVDPAAGSAHAETRGDALLATEQVSFEYSRKRVTTPALHEVSLTIASRECVALVGESGSGKSTMARVLAGIVQPTNGALSWQAQPLPVLPRQRTREQRRAIQIIFQNPDSSLNPRHTVGRILGRALALFQPELSSAERRETVASALREVQLDTSYVDRFPQQLSGGQKQRVAIARALVAQPQLLICDEITSAQDVSVQAALLELLVRLQKRHDLALLFISHDMAVVRAIADYTYVIRGGQIVEEAPTEVMFSAPADAYTVALLSPVSRSGRPGQQQGG